MSLNDAPRNDKIEEIKRSVSSVPLQKALEEIVDNLNNRPVDRLFALALMNIISWQRN